jgi:predicted ester cyclase
MNEMLEQHRHTVRRIYEECLNHHELATLREIVSDEYTGINGERGPDGFAETLRGLLTGFPDIRYAIDDVLADADRVAVRWRWEGTHLGAFRNFAATGRRVTNTGISIYRLRDGKIVDAKLESDRLGFMQAIGALPAPPVPAR